MPEKTEAQKKAQKNYMGKFVRVEIRMTPEQRASVQIHAEDHGESVNGFIGRAISETMERDSSRTPPESRQNGPESTAGAEVALHSETLEAAQRAAEAAGEALPMFITRAVSETAERDRLSQDS